MKLKSGKRINPQIIARKNMIQYECRSVYKSDAKDMVKITARVYQWVRESVGQ